MRRAFTEERIKRPTHLRNNYFCGARFERFSLRMKLHKNNEKSTIAVVKEISNQLSYPIPHEQNFRITLPQHR